MKNDFKLQTADKAVIVKMLPRGRTVKVSAYSNVAPLGTHWTLDSKHYKKLIAYKSLSALVKFTRANQTQLKAVTSCPVPVPTPAKSSEQVQDILFIELQKSRCGKDAEIVEIAVVDAKENVLFHSLVKPSKPILPIDAKYHGIQNIDVINAPSFADIWRDLSRIIGHTTIAFYNADNAKRVIMQSVAKAYDSPMFDHFYTLFPHNAILNVGALYERYNNRFPYMAGRQHINSACGQQGIFWRDLPNKRAVGDAKKSARIYTFLLGVEVA